MIKTTLRALFNEIVELMADLPGLEDRNDRQRLREVVEEYLSRYGFTFVGSGAYSRAYRHDGWGGVVLKVSFVRHTGVNKPDLTGRPQLRKFWLKPLFSSDFVMIQPLADTSENELAWREILTALGEELYDYYGTNDSNSSTRAPHDIHQGNTGFWKGRPVAFDML
jgi:hypothetical protein